ncbi:MAG: DUF3137 domain-containing protein [Clostridia bacterium]|nr:DUF3137 domain-containing protein [Clostridia bacterium]
MIIVLTGIVIPIILLLTMLIGTLVISPAVIAENIGQIYQALIAITIIPVVVILSKATKGYVFTKNVKLRNAREEFEKIYDKLLEIDNEDLHRLKKIANIFTVVDIALASIMILGIVFVKIPGYAISETVDGVVKFMALLAPFMLAGMIFLGVKHRRIYKKTYKEQVITKFVKLVDENLRYSLYGRVGDDMKNKYLVSDFEKKAFNRFSSEDYVDGKIDGKIYAEIAELDVDYAFQKKKRKFREDLFKGMFAVIRSEKDLSAWVKVTKNKFKFFMSRNKLETDDTLFEKIFDVYTDNRSVAHQIMQKEMREILMRFYVEYDLRFEVMFKENIIFMRFFTPSMFEPKLFGNSMDKKLLFTYFNIIKFISEVTNQIEKESKDKEEIEAPKKEVKFEPVKGIPPPSKKPQVVEEKKEEPVNEKVETTDVKEDVKLENLDPIPTATINYDDFNPVKETKKRNTKQTNI